MSNEPATQNYIAAGQLTELRDRLINQGPVDKLPIEILAEIFKWLKATLPQFHYSIHALPAIASVNRKWRAAAISCSFLWSELDITLNIPEDFFVRSRMQPLSLFWRRLDVNNDSLARYSAHFPRVRRLILDGTPDDNGALAFSGLTSFPLLEQLSISPATDSTTAGVFVSGHFPRLISLKITLARDFQWHHTIFSPNLRTLDVSCANLDHPPPLAELVRGLQRMPLLVGLKLTAFDPETEEVGDLASAVTLQRLRGVALIGSLGGCAAILKCLNLPLSTHIDVMCSVRADNAGHPQIQEGALLRLSEALGEKIALRDKEGSLSSPMKYMLVSQSQLPILYEGVAPLGMARLHCMRNDKPCGESLEDNMNFFNEVWSEGYIPPEKFRNGLQGIQVVISWIFPADAKFQPLPSSWTAEICHSLPLEEVTTVALDLSPNMTSMGIGRMCPNITRVFTRTIEMSGQGGGLHYLLDVDENGHRQNRLHFPKLKALLLGCPDHYSPTTFCRALDRLYLCLQILSTPSTLTLEKILLMAKQFGRSDPWAQRLLGRFQAFEAAFPRIDLQIVLTD